MDSTVPSVRSVLGMVSFSNLEKDGVRPERRNLELDEADSEEMVLYSRACQSSNSGSRCSTMKVCDLAILGNVSFFFLLVVCFPPNVYSLNVDIGPVAVNFLVEQISTIGLELRTNRRAENKIPATSDRDVCILCAYRIYKYLVLYSILGTPTRCVFLVSH